MSTPAGLDHRAYLARIGQPAHDEGAAPSLARLRALHQAHLFTVPFENLSIHYGQHVRLVQCAEQRQRWRGAPGGRGLPNAGEVAVDRGAVASRVRTHAAASSLCRMPRGW